MKEYCSVWAHPVLCLGVVMALTAPPVLSAELGSYTCEINNAGENQSGWIDIGKIVRLPYTVSSWIDKNKKFTQVDGSQSTDSQTLADIKARLEAALYWVQNNQYLVSLGTTAETNQGFAWFNIRVGDSSIVSAYANNTVNMVSAGQCGDWDNCVRFTSASSGIDYSFGMTARIYNANYSFVTDGWQQQGVVNLPLPPNEYLKATYVFTGPPTTHIGTAPELNMTSGAGAGDPSLPLTRVPQVTCTREATPMSLVLTPAEIKFGSMQPGSTAPVSQEMTWKANGTGQTPLWTMRFDTPAATGDEINLGGGRVTIKDDNMNIVKPGTDTAVTGNTGKYHFELDPSSGTPGDHAVNITVTLTAN